jgi:hypothetical protein
MSGCWTVRPPPRSSGQERTALAYAIRGGIPGSETIIVWDGGLSVVLIVAYILCRGWSGSPRATGAA